MRYLFWDLKRRSKILSTLRTSGRRARARKIEAPTIMSPVAACLMKIRIKAIPRGTSQNLIKVLRFVSIDLDILLLME